MQKKFTNKFNAFQNVQGVLIEKRSSYENFPKILQYADEFMSLFETIKEQIKTVDLEFKEVTDDKYLVKAELARTASSLASAAMVYAYDIGDPELRSYFDFTTSDLQYSRDAETIEISRNIASELAEHQEAISEYMISEQDISALQALITKFDNLHVKQETVYSNSVIETQRLEVLFDLADTLLKEKIDRLVMKMRLTDLDFYNQYFQARRISDL